MTVRSESEALRRGLSSSVVLVGVACLVAGARPAHAQFLYGITNSGGIYEINVTAKTTTLAFTTGLSPTNGLAFSDSGDGGNGQLFYRSGGGTDNGSGNFYVWNRRNSVQRQIIVPTAISSTGFLPGSSSNASWYNGAYWYVQQNSDTLVRAEISFADPTAPVVSRLTSFANFDGGLGATSYGFGDISITSTGKMYGSSGSRLFSADLSSIQVSSSGVVTGAPTGYTQVNTTYTQLQIGFAGSPTTLYAHNAVAGTGDWYTIDTATGTRTSQNFVSRDASNNILTFNDISEGSLRSAVSVNTPEPGSATLLLPLVPVTVGLWRRRRALAVAPPEAAA